MQGNTQISDAMVEDALDAFNAGMGNPNDYWGRMKNALSAALAGRVVVPLEPTDAMCLAGHAAPQYYDGAHCDNPRELARARLAGIYRAMISAAPPALERSRA